MIYAKENSFESDEFTYSERRGLSVSEQFQAADKMEIVSFSEDSELSKDAGTSGIINLKRGSISPEKIKEVGRRISKKIPAQEKQKLLEQRNMLVNKRFNGEGLSKKEERTLMLIRWKLDRIDDAEIGRDLDNLEEFVESQNQYANELTNFVEELKVAGIIKR